MSGALIEKGMSSAAAQRSSHRISSVRSTIKKLPASETRAVDFNASSTIVDDVVFIRLPEVKAVTGLSKTSIYELIRAKTFPAPVRLGPRSVAWVKAEIRHWAVERVQASRSAA